MDKIPFSVYDFFGYLASGFLVLIAADYAFELGYIANAGKEKQPIELTIFWIILAYIVGHVVAHVSSVLLEHLFLRKVLGSPETHFFSSNAQSKWRFLFPGNFQPLPAGTQKRVLEKAKSAGVEEKGRTLFFHCHSVVKKNDVVLGRLNTFLNLYGFCRNASMAMLIAFGMLSVAFAASWIEAKDFDLKDPKFLWAIFSLVISYGMFLRYLKFFRHYTLEVFYSYAD